MEKRYKLMVDPTPGGWAYGFPMALPEDVLMGEGEYLYARPDFDLAKWVVEQGYPEESFKYYRCWVEEVDDQE